MKQLLAHLMFALLGCLSTNVAYAAPQINWGDQVAQAKQQDRRSGVTVDLRSIWEANLFGQISLPNDQALDPQQVWQWPSTRFSSSDQRPIRIRAQERLVARLTVFSEKVGSDFTLSLAKPRLDAVHISYRYDSGPWTTLSAGDTIAMNRWPQPDRQPSFNLPLQAGQMDLVIQVAHRGTIDTPALLQNNRAFFEANALSLATSGVMIGVSLVIALMGLLLALNFKRVSFLSVAVMNTMMSFALMFGSGLGGMLVGTESNQFNDEIKFVINTIWCAMLPWVASLALGMRAHSQFWNWSAMAMAAAAVILSLFWSNYALRDGMQVSVLLLLFVLISYTLAMIIWAWFRSYTRNFLISAGVSLYALALVPLYMLLLGIVTTDEGSFGAAALSSCAAFCLMRGLFLQHRMGQQVVARANISPQRDVLTGLFNRDGMQAHLYKLRQRIQNENTGAVLIYVQLMGEQQAMLQYGEEGFEMGMVQVAASLSSSVSGVDGLARISRHAFATTVMMPPDPALATRVAQKILSRLMALATHGTPMAGNVRVAMSWLPLYGFRVDSLEQRSLRALETLGDAKRIVWVGGPASHAEAVQMLSDARNAYSTPSGLAALEPDTLVPRNKDESSNLYDRIHRIEREMLHGMDTRFLVAEAERMSEALNALPASSSSEMAVGAQLDPSSANAQNDFAPTQQATTQQPTPQPRIKPA